jgi:preprotein translocase subunit Sec63
MSLKFVVVGTVLLLLCSFEVINGLEDPHKVLGVSKSASQDEIKSAYKQLALKWYRNN